MSVGVGEAIPEGGQEIRGKALLSRAAARITRRRLLTVAGGALVASGSLLVGAVGLSGDLPLESLPAETLIFGSLESDPDVTVGSGDAAALPMLIAPAVSEGRSGGAAPAAESNTGGVPATDGESSVRVAVGTATESGSQSRAPAEVLAPETSTETAIRDFIATLPPADRIRIPEIDLEFDIVTVTVDSQNRVGTPSFAVGRFAGGGQVGLAGNVILSGHNDIDGAVFGKLPEVGDGAEILLRRGTYEFTYVADFAVKVWEEGAPADTRLENARYLLPTVNPITTLITCYPPWVDTHRWIVRASFLQMRELSSSVAGPNIFR